MPITITMPALSPTMTEGTLTSWLVKEGDQISPGDVIAEIETDKATMEVEAVDEGIVGKLLVPAGTEGVPVNAAIAVVLEEGEDASALEGYEPEGARVPAAEAPKRPDPSKAAEPARPAKRAAAGAEETGSEAARTGEAPAAAEDAGKAPAAPTVDGERIKASPLARRMAAQAGLDLAALKGSGPHGRIVKADIEAALEAGAPGKAAARPEARAPEAPAPRPPEGFEPPFDLEPMSQMRKTIARRMTEAKQTAPHFYMTVDCRIDALLDLRKQLNARVDGDVKLSVNDLIIKACALALMKVPAANVAYADGQLKRYKTADISVAVATERGLITPVIRRAEQKGLMTISKEMKSLAEKARAGKLMPEDYLGGSFSLSNLGMYGVKQFEAVLNPPQACILAVGAGEQRPVVQDGALAIATVMSCTLSVDHRAVDGAIGAEYLAALKKLLEDPVAMML